MIYGCDCDDRHKKVDWCIHRFLVRQREGQHGGKMPIQGDEYINQLDNINEESNWNEPEFNIDIEDDYESKIT